MLAGTQCIDQKIGAGTKIWSGIGAPDGHFVGFLGLRICNLKIRKYRVRAKIFYFKILQLPKLPAQSRLPCLRGHIVRLAMIRDCFRCCFLLHVIIFCQRLNFKPVATACQLKHLSKACSGYRRPDGHFLGLLITPAPASANASRG